MCTWALAHNASPVLFPTPFLCLFTGGRGRASTAPWPALATCRPSVAPSRLQVAGNPLPRTLAPPHFPSSRTASPSQHKPRAKPSPCHRGLRGHGHPRAMTRCLEAPSSSSPSTSTTGPSWEALARRHRAHLRFCISTAAVDNLFDPVQPRAC